MANEYRELKRIACGDVNDVFLAEKTGLMGFQKLVVVKRLHSAAHAHRKLVIEVLDEAKLVAALSHRNIAQVLDVGEDEEGTYIAMEFVPGGTLALLQQKVGKLPPAHALAVVGQLADALAHAHTALSAAGEPLHVVHRSVTPENALLNLSGTVKLIGFGQARSALRREMTGAGEFKGNPLYYSPERCRGEPLGPRSDLFQLGLLLCGLIGGQHPYWRGNLTSTVMAMQSDPPRLPSVDDASLAFIDPLLTRLLASRADDRFPDAAGAADAIEELLRKAPPPATRLAEVARAAFGEEVGGLLAEVQRTLEATPEPTRWGGPAPVPTAAAENPELAPTAPPRPTAAFAAPVDPQAEVTVPILPKPAAPDPAAPAAAVEAAAATLPAAIAPNKPGPTTEEMLLLALRPWWQRPPALVALAIVVLSLIAGGLVVWAVRDHLIQGRAAPLASPVAAVLPPAVPVTAPVPAPAPPPAVVAEPVKIAVAPEPKLAPPAVHPHPVVANHTAERPRAPEPHHAGAVLVAVGSGSPRRVALAGPRGQATLYADATNSVTIDYVLQGEVLHATLSSNPWAVVSVDGISLSRTPVALKLQAKSQRIELRRPGLAPLNLAVSLEHH